MSITSIIRLAKERSLRNNQLREDSRYLQVLGRLKHEGLIKNKNVRSHRKKFLLDDALWVGENIEPRVLELLPAILIKRPGLMLFENTPEDLKIIINNIRKGIAKDNFRGIPARSYVQWVSFVGRKGRLPSITKTFRFTQEEQELLKKLSKEKNITESNVIRLGLKALSQQTKE